MPYLQASFMKLTNLRKLIKDKTMTTKFKQTPQLLHVTKLIEDFFSKLGISMFEGPQSNSGYKEYSDYMYRTHEVQRYSIRHMFGEWGLQTENMYGWDWQITMDIFPRKDEFSLILRRIDCLGNATDMLLVCGDKLATVENLDEIITMLLLQGAHTDHLSDLSDRGFSPVVPKDKSDNKSPWDVFNNTSKQKLAVAGVTTTGYDNTYGVQTNGITKSFSTDKGNVNKFWLSTTADHNYLTICGMGYTFTRAGTVPVDLEQIDKSFKHFFGVIQSDLLSSTPNQKYMAKVYQNNLIVLGGLKETVGIIDKEKEMVSIFQHLVTRMETIHALKSDKVRFCRNRVGDVTGVFYYPTVVGESKPLRIWLTNKKVNHTPMDPLYTGTACLTIESSQTKSANTYTLFHDDLSSTTGIVDVLELIRDNFKKDNHLADELLVNEILNS